MLSWDVQRTAVSQCHCSRLTGNVMGDEVRDKDAKCCRVLEIIVKTLAFFLSEMKATGGFLS